MSKEAQQWCASLPVHATRTLVAFRVLDKLADAHHTDSDHAYRDVKKLALELVVSERTIQRALRELEKAQLLIVGDQNVIPRAIPVNRAPTAYRLPWRVRWEPQLDLGVTTAVTPPRPVDNSSWGDKSGGLGVTPGVAHRTQEHLTQVVEPPQSARECLDDASPDGRHLMSRKIGVCVYCGLGRAS